MSATRRRFLLGATAMGGVAIGQRVDGLRILAPGSSSRAGAAPMMTPEELLAAPVREEAEAAYSAAAPAQAADPRVPTPDEIAAFYRTRRNWGRWGSNDEKGAINLITPAKRAAAAALVKSGRTISLSRVFEPEQHFIRKTPLSGGGFAADYYGFIFHGGTVTHIDALCHIWEEDGGWQGRDPDETVDTHGAHFADITAWSDGIVTRGVLLDVPRHRNQPYVTADRPVHAWELEAVANAQGVEVGPGDALIVHSGWQAWMKASESSGGQIRPGGLHASCAQFIRDRDISLLCWDLMDAGTSDSRPSTTAHGVLQNFGVALVDNALLEPLATACADAGRYEFLFMVLPLNVARGTGSPVNPVAML